MIDHRIRVVEMTVGEHRIRVVRWIFGGAGAYGVAIMFPCYFLADRTIPGASGVAETFYFGFVSVVLAFQMLFFAIARDPVRLRPAMLAAMLDKAAFIVPPVATWWAGSIDGRLLPFVCVEILLLLAFAWAHWIIRSSSGAVRAAQSDFGTS